ncbi:MAG: HI0074 family nucleotidyltransferase substrate-binding subunit [Thiomargarita sp.]|nr:HI0074 family nucleotidyltransferase substrate-binding subunit [Thiomargarita sp.]
MERLTQRLQVAKKALNTLKELEKVPVSAIQRDATIQRFEYSFEAIWKAAKQYLIDIEGLESGSPKGVIRACFQVGILTKEQTQQALSMTDARNLTSHTYNESLADNIFSKIADYYCLMSEWLQMLEKNTH